MVESKRDAREHHERFGLGVFILRRSLPLAPVPLLVEEKLVILVREGDRRERPRALEAGAVYMFNESPVR